MIYARLQSRLSAYGLTALAPYLEEGFLHSLRHGDFPRWRRLVRQLPDLKPSVVSYASRVRIGGSQDGDAESLRKLESALRELIPWRKGPFELFGVHIESEWRSDLKWDRLANAIVPLAGKTVLDVGCGNGYHCFRMRGSDASLVIGLEPHLPYVGQFGALKRYVPDEAVHVLPLSLEQWPDCGPVFDTVFTMGVLYHARSPFDHLLAIRRCLKPGGQLIVESIVVPGDAGYSLTPVDRYARMGNVWFVPSVTTIEGWLRRCGFADIRLLDECRTTAAEQRQTDWMPFDSLEASLMESDVNRTVEGYPAPRRAILLATLP